MDRCECPVSHQLSAFVMQKSRVLHQVRNGGKLGIALMRKSDALPIACVGPWWLVVIPGATYQVEERLPAERFVPCACRVREKHVSWCRVAPSWNALD